MCPIALVPTQPVVTIPLDAHKVSHMCSRCRTILYADPDTLGVSVGTTGADPPVADPYAGGEQAAITNNIWKLGTAFAT